MKRVILFCVFFSVVFTGFSQEIPTDIQKRLAELQTQIRLRLDSIRVSDVGVWGGNTSLAERLLPEQRNRADSLGLNLHWGMVYDEPMRERLVQLLNNEFREDEVDILVNRTMESLENMGIAIFEQRAMSAMEDIVNSKEFRQVQDSLDRSRDRTIRDTFYSNFEVFRYLQYDTLAVFRQAVDSVRKQRREDIKIRYLNQRLSVQTMQVIAQTSGRIGDERFVEPLRNALRRPGIDNREFNAIREALVRMKIEPYYSEFVEQFTFSVEEIKELRFVFHLHFYSDLLRTQSSFRQLSKFLHSNAYTDLTGDGAEGDASLWALSLIRRNIVNEDLQALINSPDFDSERDILKVYEWMQANYGNYIIRRVW